MLAGLYQGLVQSRVTAHANSSSAYFQQAAAAAAIGNIKDITSCSKEDVSPERLQQPILKMTIA